MYYLGNQTWECSSDINEIFTTPEPIRDDCIEGWIDDIGDLLDNENITSSNISDTIKENLANATSGITAKGLIELSKDLDKLMNKRDQERYEIGKCVAALLIKSYTQVVKYFGSNYFLKIIIVSQVTIQMDSTRVTWEIQILYILMTILGQRFIQMRDTKSQLISPEIL